MGCRRCASCGQTFRPRPQVSEQRFCAAKACQRERKRRWQQAKRASDPDYRLNQAQAQQSWGARHPAYWQEYRRSHPEYCERNRKQQRERDRRRAQTRLATMDAWTDESVIPSGTYRLTPVTSGKLAKMDAWTVAIALLSSGSGPSGASCKERTS
jgi:hypothetical protein